MKILRGDFRDAFGAAAPVLLVGWALACFAELNDLPHVHLGVAKSEAGHTIEFLGATAHSLGRGESTAELSRSVARRDRAVERLSEILRSGTAAFPSARKIARYLYFARTAAVGRFGRVAIKPAYRSIAARGELPKQVAAASTGGFRPCSF